MFHKEVHVYISYSKEQQILECKVNGLIVALVKYGEFFLLLYTILLLLHYSLQTLPKGLHLFQIKMLLAGNGMFQFPLEV